MTIESLSLNVDRIKLLTDALRSGKYSQVRRQLRKNDSYCCLGVACEIFHQQTGLGSWTAGESFEVDGELSSTVMPEVVSKWFGFSTYGGQHVASDDLVSEMEGVGLDGPFVALFDLNDYLSWDFVKIADYIDSHVEDFDAYSKVQHLSKDA